MARACYEAHHPVALRREGDALADLCVAFTGADPRPALLEGTAALPAARARHHRSN
jgi:hypothetical protein